MTLPMRRLDRVQVEKIAEHEARHPFAILGCEGCGMRYAARFDLDALTAQAAAIEPGDRHEIIESFVEDRTQTVRCRCGRSAMFSRERDYYGSVKRARSLGEFVCAGEEITLKQKMIRGVD